MEVGISRDTGSRDIIRSMPELLSASKDAIETAKTSSMASNSMIPTAGTSATAVAPVTAGKEAITGV
jgi:hypothetical protein